MAMAGLYKRILPSPPAIDFASPEGKILFRESFLKGTMEGFFKLIAYFQTQSEPAYCGLASLAMVLNALAIDPCTKWKGPWRWFDESMLDCCEPLEQIVVKGISFGKVVCLAHCAGAKVEAFRTNQSSLDEFRKYVIACSTSDDCHVIASYHRGTFKQTGTGHFSPIGGYHPESDMVLILDVARFKYPPHWVPLSLLWEAMDTVVDQATGLRRGFMLLSRRHQGPALLYSLSCKQESWIATAKCMMDDVPLLLISHNVKDIRDVLSAVIFSLPPGFADFLTWVAELHRSDEKRPNQEETQRRALKEEVLRLVQQTSLHNQVLDTLFLEDLRCWIEWLLGLGESLPDATASFSFPKAWSMSDKFDSSDPRHDGSVRCLRANGDHVTMEPWTIANASSNILTTLLLALPPQTWSCIKDEEILQEVLSLVSIEGLPTLLKEEVLYVRGQLLLFKRCNDCWVEDSLDAPPLL